MGQEFSFLELVWWYLLSPFCFLFVSFHEYNKYNPKKWENFKLKSDYIPLFFPKQLSSTATSSLHSNPHYLDNELTPPKADLLSTLSPPLRTLSSSWFVLMSIASMEGHYDVATMSHLWWEHPADNHNRRWSLWIKVRINHGQWAIWVWNAARMMVFKYQMKKGSILLMPNKDKYGGF